MRLDKGRVRHVIRKSLAATAGHSHDAGYGEWAITPRKRVTVAPLWFMGQRKHKALRWMIESRLNAVRAGE